MMTAGLVDQPPADGYGFSCVGLVLVNKALGSMTNLSQGMFLGVAASKLTASACLHKRVDPEHVAAVVLIFVLVVQCMLFLSL